MNIKTIFMYKIPPLRLISSRSPKVYTTAHVVSTATDAKLTPFKF